jgi:hypothetical protein
VISFVASASASGNGNVATTSAIDTTGANLIVVCTSHLLGTVLTDNKGNTPVGLTLQYGGIPCTRLWVFTNPAVGSGHIFTSTSASQYPALAVLAFSGCDTSSVFDVENGVGGSTAVSSKQTGSVTPSQTGELIVTGGIAEQTSGTRSIDSGFTKVVDLSTTGSAYGVLIAYKIKTDASAENPTWSTDTGTCAWPLVIAAFKPAAPITLVASAIANGTTSGATTSAVDTTGANLLVLTVAYSSTSGPTPLDSKNNIWTPLTAQATVSGSGQKIQIYYVTPSPVVGSGHTFSIGGTSSLGTIAIQAFSGVRSSSAYDQQNGTATTTGSFVVSSLQPGSITPSEGGQLFVAAICTGSTSSLPTLDSGYTDTGKLMQVNGQSYGLATAYLVYPSNDPHNPTWTWVSNNNAATVIATFRSDTPVVPVTLGLKTSRRQTFTGARVVPQHPSLWQGCVGAWSPQFGPESPLRDLSGRSNTATFTLYDSTKWVTHRGITGYDWDNNGASRYASALLNPVTGAGARSYSGWVYWPDISKYCVMLDCGAVTTRARLLLFVMKTAPYAGLVGQVAAEFNGTTGLSTNTVPVGVWTHIYFQVHTDSANGTYYINGVNAGYRQSGGAPGAINTGPGVVHLGAGVDHTSDNTLRSIVADVRIYNRFLTIQEIQLLALRPSIAYEWSSWRSFSMPLPSEGPDDTVTINVTN